MRFRHPRLTKPLTKYLLVLCLAAVTLISWSTFTAHTARLDKPKNPAQVQNSNLGRKTKKLTTDYGKLPLSYEVNRGQADAGVQYLARGPGYNIFLTPTEATLVLHNRDASSIQREEDDGGGDAPGFHRQPLELLTNREDASVVRPTVLRMQLQGARANKIESLEELPGKVNYFIGNDSSKWLTDIPTYRKVAYREVYPGVDLVYYGNQQQLEYDLVVAPAADPNLIKIRYEGAEKLRVNREGTLSLKTSAGELQQPKPLIYQQENGERKLIEGHYVLRGKKSIGFRVSNYNHQKPLVIDPKLVYLSLINGGGNGIAIAVDSSGSAYVTGSIFSDTLNPTAGAFQTALATNGGAFVTKLTPTGTNVTYSTYLAGTGGAEGYGIAVDGLGNAYITGWAGAGFPITPGAFQTTLRGGADSFVTKLNPTGSGLVYSTFYGGNNYEEGDGIAVDNAGNVYVGGSTSSTDLVTTANAAQALNKGGFDGFAIELNATGTSLTYGTYFGGGGIDFVNGTIGVDALGNAYITGQTNSFNFPQVNSLMGPGGLDRGLFKSANSGSSWNLSTTGLKTSGVFALAVDKNASTIVYAATAGGVSKSSDGGLTWSDTGPNNALDQALAMADSSTIYVATDGGVYKTTNAGASWSLSYQPISGGAIVIDPSNTATVYAGGVGGIAKTTNAGGNWSVSTTTFNVRAMAIDPVTPSTLYASARSANGRVFKSTNSGGTWVLSNTGLPATTNIFSLAVDPSSPSTVYAGTGVGIYKSTNGGGSWSAVNNGLLVQYSDSVGRLASVSAIAIASPSTTLYATANNGPLSTGPSPVATVFKSIDGGANWTASTTGLTGISLSSVTLDPSDNTKLYVGSSGDNDGFFVKLNSSGTALLNSTYISSGRFDTAVGVAVDSTNSPYILGYTQGSSFSTTAGAFKTVLTGSADAYVMKLNPSGSQIVYSTFLGGNDAESTLGGIAVDALGSAYVTGFTGSADF